MSKRGTDLDPGPKEKKCKTEIEDEEGQVQIGRINNIELLNMKILEYQNKKLVENVEARKRYEDELKKRLDSLEERHSADDAVICIVNQHWNQLDEDVRILVERFDFDDLEIPGEVEERPALTSFLTSLSSWDHTESDQQLRNRVEFSKRAIGKLISAYDRTAIRNHKLWKLISDGQYSEKVEGDKDNNKTNDPPQKVTTFVNDSIKDELKRALNENKRLQDTITKLHETNHELSSKNKHYEDKKMVAETLAAELRNKIEDLEHDWTSNQQKIVKIENKYNNLRKVKRSKEIDDGHIVSKSGSNTMVTGESVNISKFQEINDNFETERDLAYNRLQELQKLQEDYQSSLKNNELLKMDVSLATLPESVITESIDYRCLKSHFSVLFTESLQLKTAHDEAFVLIKELKQSHQKQIEKMEMTELLLQKDLRTEVIQLEDQLSQVKREHQMLRVEFEQTLANNERTAPINTEMRALITSLKNHNDRLKNELQRYRRKYQDLHSDLIRVKEELLHSDESISLLAVRRELKACEQREKDMKISLDSYRHCTKDQRDKATILHSEKICNAENEELKLELQSIRIRQQNDNDVYNKKDIKMNDLQVSLQLQKQEEEALLSEMEVTGQAFEEMQEQNIRLLQQIREKDDAHFKLMSERIKSNQIHGLLREEKEVLGDIVCSLKFQVKNQNDVVRGLEERESTLIISVSLAEKELTNHQLSTEMFKRKAMENSQSAADLKLHLTKYHDQLKQSQKIVMEKTHALQQETFKYKRVQEEIGGLRRKFDRIKKIESASSADEVLMEEIKEYKEQLTCQCCKIKRKDAVLTKCYHVFCLSCLRTRYETRQRKCPKCNATFGAKDFHRIYLES